MKEANLQRPALRCARCGHGPSTHSHPGGEDSLSDLPMRDDPVEHTVASDLPPHRETAEQGQADGLNAAANAATGAGEPLISGTAFPDLGRLVRTALLEMRARAVAVEAALGMLLAAEASRNPALPEAMRAKLDDMLRAMPEPSDPGLPAAPVPPFTRSSGPRTQRPRRPKPLRHSANSRPCGTPCGAASDHASTPLSDERSGMTPTSLTFACQCCGLKARSVLAEAPDP